MPVLEIAFTMRKLFAFALITMAFGSAGGASERPVEGLWLTQGKSGVVEIYRCSESVLCGRLVWFRVKPDDPDPQFVDIHNPAPGLRTRPLCGLTIMWGLQPDGPDRWTDGSLYDPESGNTYNGYIMLNSDGTLTLRGYIAISLFGRSETWTRYTQTLEGCPRGEKARLGNISRRSVEVDRAKESIDRRPRNDGALCSTDMGQCGRCLGSALADGTAATEDQHSARILSLIGWKTRTR